MLGSAPLQGACRMMRKGTHGGSGHWESRIQHTGRLNQSIATLEMLSAKIKILTEQHNQREDMRYHPSCFWCIDNFYQLWILHSPTSRSSLLLDLLALCLECVFSFFITCSHSNSIFRDVSSIKIQFERFFFNADPFAQAGTAVKDKQCFASCEECLAVSLCDYEAIMLIDV